MLEQELNINQFIFDLSEIPVSDPLVDCSMAEKTSISFAENTTLNHKTPITADWTNLLKTAQIHKRELDVNSLCLAQGKISWEYKGKRVESPLLLTPIQWKINKASQEIEWSAEPENTLFNPFVKTTFIRDFEISLEEKIDFSAINWQEELAEFLAEKKVNCTILPFEKIGIFHHHRYAILRDLELIQQAPETSDLVKSLLGGEHQSPIPTKFTNAFLVPTDADQLAVFEFIATQNTVIQGPPGTGKTQVLINLLGKCIAQQGMTLVVSEKRVALEVLVKKLSELEPLGLDNFCFIAHSQTKPHDFILQLKKNWQRLEQTHAKTPNNLLLSEQLKDNLQLLLDKINNPILTSGIPFSTFQSLVNKIDTKKVSFHTNVPSVADWLALKPQLLALESEWGSLEPLRFLKQSLISIDNIDQYIESIHGEYKLLNEEFGATTIQEFEALEKSIIRCQIIDTESFKSYKNIVEHPRERKRFEKLKLELTNLTVRFEGLKTEKELWKRELSRSETESLLGQLNTSSSWFAKRKINRWFQTVLANPSVSPKIALTNWKEVLDVRDRINELHQQFREMGIARPEVELESAAYVIAQLDKEDANELNTLVQLSVQERRNIMERGERIRGLLRNLNRDFSILSHEPLAPVFSSIEQLIVTWVRSKSVLNTLPTVLFPLFSKHSTVQELENSIVYSNWVLMESQFPELAKYSGEVLNEKLDRILTAEQEEFAIFAQQIHFERHQQFERYATLLRTPATKLNPSEKSLKAQLKQGKSLLVKEFGKSRQHQTIRELLASDARIWIELLTPIWLSTPLQVANHFPMERDLFEWVIFDEASQIPIPHAMGSLHRGKRAVVAGDEQQMSPSRYFATGKTAIDLLHQANYYYAKTPLKHHYRSEHPALISFSNTHFYNNELVVYPTANAPFPLHRHVVENGLFTDRQNKTEACEVAAFLEHINWSQTVGIVAFSEQQLNCIWEHCSAKVQEKITLGLENNTVFFKALEQIQGDEASMLIISLGYAKDETGVFKLRFGPLNQLNGYKRLNVLLTRAKSAMHFFTSVKASDFSISSNESVTLLRLFLQQLENTVTEENEMQLPFGLSPITQSGNQLKLEAIYQHIPIAEELVTFHRVMKKRGWKINYD